MIDLVIGGSPCQGFSFAGKQLNFEDLRSKLFFEYVDILNYVKKINPNVLFLLENVVMKQEYQDVISKYMGVEPILISSALVSAQVRKRLYWTNIPNVTLPEYKNISLKDILEDISLTEPAAIVGRRLNAEGHREDYNKEIPITQCLEVRATNTNKSNCLTTVEKDNVLTSLPVGRHPDTFKNKLPFRYYTRTEYERLQTLPDGYTSVISESKAKKHLGNAWTVDVIAHIFSYIQNKHLDSVLSLFDGISCGQVALERAGIKYNKYFASEIDKYAIQVTQKNFPDTIQLGDITKWKEWF